MTEDELQVDVAHWFTPQPEGEWGYEVDWFGVAYAEPGSALLFSRTDGVQRTDLRNGRVEAWNWVRLGPDVEYRNWNNQYVSLIEEWSEAGYQIVLYMILTVADNLITRVRLEVPDGRWDRWHLAPRVPLPAAPRLELEMRMARLTRWYAQARAEQEGGLPLVTAYERYLARRAEPNDAQPVPRVDVVVIDQGRIYQPPLF